MKKLLLTVALAIVSLNAETIDYGRVTGKAVDGPRYVNYPYVGRVDVNVNNIYWLQIDNKWHRVTAAEYVKSNKGQFFSRKNNIDFYPVF